MKRIIKNRKVYSKPELEVVEVDHEISFIMMTEPPGDPGGGFGAAMQAPPSSASSPVEATPPSFESNPFGGSSPDY